MNIKSLLLVWLAVSVPVFAAERIDLATFDSGAEYRTTLGSEFPGARGAFAWTRDGASGGGLKIDYDFTQGGNYVGWYYEGFIPTKVSEVSLGIRTARELTVSLRVFDKTGQAHQFQQAVRAGKDWQTVTYAVPETSGHHWGGKNDGKIHFPLAWIMIGIERSAELKGTVLIDDLRVTSPLPQAELAAAREEFFWKNAEILFETGVPGNVSYPNEKVKGTLRISPVPRSGEVKVAGRILNAARQAVGELTPIVLSSRSQYAARVSLPTELGFYYVLLTVTDGTRSKKAEVRYAVIPENPCVNAKEPSSPFGVNTHFNQGNPAELGKIVKRLGIAWIRDCEARPDDRAYRPAVENNLCYMPCFTMYRDPSWIKKSADGTWDFSEAVKFHGEFARKYGKEVDYYDLVNEPQDVWARKFGGNWSGGPWQKVFVEYGKAVTKAIKDADPGAKVLWEDLDILLFYRHYYDLGAAGLVDLISPHAYNLHPSSWYPEEQPILTQIAEFERFVKEKKLPWRLWHGEMGAASYHDPKVKEHPPTDRTCYYPASELEQAQRLVRMMVLHLSRGVEKVFWYDMMNDGTEPGNCEHNFGLVRNDRTPKPAAVAYANLTYQLRNCRWLGRYVMGGNAEAYAYAAERTGKPVVIAWLRRGQKTEDLRIPSDVREVTITDIFGAAVKRPVKDHVLRLKLTETPVYVEGLTMADMQPFVQ